MSFVLLMIFVHLEKHTSKKDYICEQEHLSAKTSEFHGFP